MAKTAWLYNVRRKLIFNIKNACFFTVSEHHISPLSYITNLLILDSYQADSCLDRWNTYLTNKKWDTPLKNWSLWQNFQFEFEQVEKEGWKLFHINDIGTYSLSNTSVMILNQLNMKATQATQTFTVFSDY